MTEQPPERIWIDGFGGNWSPVSGGTQRHEYIRADLFPQWQPIETAPKGEKKAIKVGNKGSEKIVHVPYVVLAPTSDGHVVLTYWNAYSGKWSMFSKEHPPTYWMPLPDPPCHPAS